jgi:hypothetical protein
VKIYAVFEGLLVAVYLSHICCIAQMLAKSFSAKKQNYDAETDKGQVYCMLQRKHTIIAFHATCNNSVRIE